MLGFKGPAQPSPALGDALNAGYLYLEVRCLGCDTHQTVALNIVRRPKATPIHELSATCAARTARRFGAIPTSAAIWSRCGRPRFRRSIHHQPGGRASADVFEDKARRKRLISATSLVIVWTQAPLWIAFETVKYGLVIFEAGRMA